MKKLASVFVLSLFVFALMSSVSAVTFEPDYGEDYDNYFYISEIKVPNNIGVGDSFTVDLYVEGVALKDGSTLTSVDTDTGLSINPSSVNLLVNDGDNRQKFTAYAGEVVGSYDIEFEVCSTNQFGSNYCDKEMVSVSVSEDGGLSDNSEMWILIVVSLIIIISFIVYFAMKKK